MKKTLLPFLFCSLILLTLCAEAQPDAQALFTVSSQKVCLGTPVQITDLSHGTDINGDVTYLFGDGTQSSPPNPNPIHTYTTANTFTIRQIVPIVGTAIDPQTGNSVGYVSYSLPVTVVANTPLDVNFEIGIPGDVTLFITDTRFDAYDIDFGDGSAMESVSRDVSGITSVAHTYEDYFMNEFNATVKGKFSAGNDCPNAQASTMITAYVTPTVAAEETQTILLYPNPMLQGEPLHLTNDHFKPTQIMLYCSSGNKVFESIDLYAPLSSVDLSKLQPGLYLVKLINQQNEFVTKQLMIK